MTEIDPARLRAELKAWLVLATLCAVPSTFAAVSAGYTRLVDWLAMATGVGVAAWLFARTSSRRARAENQRWRSALRWAAAIKAGAASFGLVLTVGPFDFIPDWLRQALSAAFWLDQLTGFGFVLLIGHAANPIAEYVLVLLTTLLQGAAIALEIAAIARLMRWALPPQRRGPFR